MQTLVMASAKLIQRSKLSRYRNEIVAGLLITVVLVAIGTLLGHGILKSEEDAYERGARAAVLHTVCLGSSPTMDYLRRAFRWGDPRTCDDVRRVEGRDTRR